VEHENTINGGKNLYCTAIEMLASHEAGGLVSEGKSFIFHGTLLLQVNEEHEHVVKPPQPKGHGMYFLSRFFVVGVGVFRCALKFLVK
jgi:hypothetical protein